MFRAAQISDTPFILELLREFYSKVGGIYGIPFDDSSAWNTILDVVRATPATCLVGPSSVAGAVIRPYPYNDRHRIGQVKFWYFRRAREARILEALAVELRKAGATHLSASAHFPDCRIARFYKKRLALTEVESISIGSLT